MTTTIENKPTVNVRMIGRLTFGPTSRYGIPARVLEMGETYRLSAREAAWLVDIDMAELA
ncbi:hypothetical protein [Streptomyces sp. BPTC-684]|uniref:hypothetical protein n=1 Tax=Streptomyces sp. BPTC-684 TaxID=3043734 RepID=UPI0024B077AD|nr:hypothetical protein [Streptomyces sp. BPTC-684]WHM38849.1 hypothetical protein QIY60_19295 [Streptomyces sp. BPTC-684]